MPQSGASDGSSGAVIGGVVGGVAVAIVIIAALMVVIVWMRRSHSNQRKLADSNESIHGIHLTIQYVL